MDTRILIVDDDRRLCEMLKADLKRRGFEALATASPYEAMQRLLEEDFAVVMTDMNMQGMSGIDVCKRVAESREEVPVIVMTAFGSTDAAISAIRAGAYDFVTKPFDLEEIALSLERALKHRALHGEVKRLRRIVSEQRRFDETFGASAAMIKVYDLVARVAESDATVLVTGESGTGKELIAKAIHQRSERREGPFVAINCAAMPENLLESELFGHVKGAFTDARMARPGLFIKASKGTVLLDEIGEMPAGMQSKLLRALQERTVRPVGGDREHPFDARIIAATNRDLDGAVQRHAFREDLFYRINVVGIQVPPLRVRGNDVVALADLFLERYAAQNRRPTPRLSSAARNKLLGYSWPGNVRELQNCIERAVALGRSDEIGVEDLPEKIREFASSRIPIEGQDPLELLPMQEMERRYILRVIDALGGNKSAAAHVLGFNRQTLYRKLEQPDVEGSV